MNELYETMTLEEFFQWQEFFMEEPPLTERVDMIGGIVASTIANVNRSKKSSPFDPEDFMPVQSRRRKLAEEATQDQLLLNFVLAMGGEIARSRKS